MNTMGQTCLNTNVPIFLCTFFLTSCASFNVTIVVLQPNFRNASTDSPVIFDLPDYITSVEIVDETEVIFLFNKDSKKTISWVFVIDMRGHSCPTDFPFSIIGYLTVNAHPCSTHLVDSTRHMNVRTYAFDYRLFMHHLIRHSGLEDESVTVMYDSTGQEHQELQDLTSAGKMFFQIDVSLENCSVKHKLVLKTIASKTEVKYIMVIAAASCVENILNQAKQLDMVLGRYYWIIFTTDARVPSCKECDRDSIIYVRNNNVITPDMHSIPLVERLVEFTSSVIDEAASQEDMTTLCECDNHCFETVHDAVAKLSGSERGIYLQGDYLKQNPLSFDIFRYVHNGSLTKVGQWNGDKIKASANIYPDKTTSVVLRVVSVVEPPFVFRNTTGDRLSYYGYSIDAIDEIAKRTGFAFTVKECDGRFYGNVGIDGQWTGCIGNMLRGEADIIVGALTVTAEREKVVDFTLPYYDFAGIQILMKKPNREISLFYFADVFTPQSWICLGVVIVVTSILLLLFDKFTPIADKDDEVELSHSFNLKESIWYVVGSLTMSGGGEPPRSIPARILVAGFWFFSIVLMSTFTANLAAFLTVSRMGASITNLNDLAAQSDVRFSVVKDTSIMSYFERMAAIEENFYTIWKDMSMGVYGNSRSLAVWDYPLGDKYVNIWKRMNITGLMNSTEDAMARVVQGNFAYMTDSPVVKYMTSRDCDLTAIGNVFSIRPYAFALKNKSSWTKKISSAILELQKERILEQLKMKWWTEGSVQCSDSVSDRGLDLQSLAGSFIVVAVGISSGLLMLILEFLWTRFSTRGSLCQIKSVVKNENRAESSKADKTNEKSPDVKTRDIADSQKPHTQYSLYGDEDTLY